MCRHQAAGQSHNMKFANISLRAASIRELRSVFPFRFTLKPNVGMCIYLLIVWM
jgi:hypothetical protein